MTNDKKFDTLADSLDIDVDFNHAPSLMRERLDNIASAEDQEYQVALANLMDLMKDGADAMADIKSLALQTQSPRFYETMVEMLKTMVQAQRELMEMKAIEQKLKEKEKDPIELHSQTNQIFVGSTSELQDLLKQKQLINK